MLTHYFGNDPAAGSPTATLLRLLDGLVGAIRRASQTPKNLNSTQLITTTIPSSDGRCVQIAGTYSMDVDDVRLQEIPRS